MAYKFQVGPATLSGSTKFEEELEAAGGFKPSGVDDTALDVAADSFFFRDADGTMKRDTMADYATAIAGDGLAASSGVLAVGVDDSTVELNSDALRIKDAGVTGAKLNTDVISAQTELASDGLAAADEMMISDGGVLKKIGVDNLFKDGPGLLSAAAVAVADDHFMFLDGGATGDTKVESVADLMTAVAGNGLAAASGVLSLDSSEVADAAVASGDKFVFHDATDDSTKKESIDDIATLFAGDGLTASSAVLAVGAGALIDVQANQVDVDLTEATEGAIASGDYLIFLDGGATGTHAKENIDDIATLFAGDGLAAASAVLSVQVSGAVKLASDKVGISGSIAGIGLSYDGGVDSIESIDLDLNELSAGAIAHGDSIAFIDANDSNVTKKEAVADLATLFAGDGLSAASSVMALDLNELTAAAVDVANDSFAIIDANDSNGSRKESIADLVTAVAGNGLAAASGVLSLDASEVAGATLASGDHLVFHDVTDDSTKKETIDDIATFMAGNGLAASSGVLALDASEVAAAAVASGDAFVFEDATDNSTKKETIDDIATFMAGDGLIASSGVLAVNVADMATAMTGDVADTDEFAISDAGTMKKVDFSVVRDAVFADVSGDATVAAGGALTIAATAVESGMLNNNVISGQTDIGGALATTDEILVSDGGTLRRTDLSRFATMMAGDQLTAASGQLHFRLEITEIGDGDTLTQGVHYLGDLTSNATLTLPASPDVGDQVTVKAKGLTGAVVIINKAGSQTIDGETSVTIESPYGAVSMVYVANNDWRLI